MVKSMTKYDENSIKVYKDEKWGILEYFKEQKRLGKIKRLGFSCHCSVELLKEFLDSLGSTGVGVKVKPNFWLGSAKSNKAS